ncbi:MAG TPA: DUF4252 domain-containing protein [Thermoanaerobaculia bacterium]|nr:DUF4252 domain-containing protein [Thermoanaerobaculia bacterium]
MPRRSLPFLLIFTLALTVAAALRADSGAEASPGALPFGELEIFAPKDLTTEINLEGALLKLIGNATGEDSPEFAKLISGLQAIRVQVAPLKNLDPGKVRAKLDQAVHWLDSRGWTAIVRSRDKGEETYIYTREIKGQIVGLTVLSFEPGKEAAVINIVGHLDPAQLGRLGRTMNLPQLEKVAPKEKPRDGKRPG